MARNSRFPLAKSNEAQNTKLTGTVRFLAPINGFPNVASQVSAIGLTPQAIRCRPSGTNKMRNFKTYGLGYE